MKKVLRIIGTVLAVILLLVIGVGVAVQSPAVQTFVGKRVVAILKDKIDGDIHFEKIQVKPFDALVLKNVVILDRKPYDSDYCAPVDTFVKAGYITARFSLRGLFAKEGVHVFRAGISDGSFNLVTEPLPDGGTTTNLARIFRLKPTEKDPDKQLTGNLFDARTVEIRNFSFRMVNYPALEDNTKTSPEGSINFSDLHILDADIRAERLRFRDGVLTGRLEHLSAREKSGLHLRNVSGDIRYSAEATRIDDLCLQDDFSDLKLSFLSLDHPGDAFQHFLTDVRLNADIQPSLLDMRTIAFFSPVFGDPAFRADIQGKVSGPVSRLSVRNLSFRDQTSGVQAARVDGTVSGLPDASAMFLNYDIKQLQFTTEGLGTFIGEWAQGVNLDLGSLAKNETFVLDAKVKGPIRDLTVDADIGSEIGGLTASVNVLHLLEPSKPPLVIGGSIQGDNFDLGRFLGTDAVRHLTGRAVLSARLLPGGPEVDVDTLSIRHLRALDYDYSNISASGSYRNNTAEAVLTSRDPNLDLDLRGLFRLPGRDRDGQYQLSAQVNRADLYALHFDKRDTTSVVSFLAEGNLTGKAGLPLLDGLDGTLDIRNLLLRSSRGLSDIGDIRLAAQKDGASALDLSSSFADIHLSAGTGFSTLVNDVKRLTWGRELPALTGEEPVPWSGTPYDVSINLHDSRSLLAFAVPGLYLADSTDLRLKVSPEGILDANLKSPRLAFGNKYLRNVTLALDNRDDRLHAELSGSELSLGNLKLLKNALKLDADDDGVRIGYAFDNGTEKANRGEFDILAKLSRQENGNLAVEGEIRPSTLWYEGEPWRLQSSRIAYADKEVGIQRFTVWNDGQSLDISGGFSPVRTDTLAVNLQRFELGMANSLLGNNLDIKGLATGNAYVISPSGEMPGILVQLDCENVQASGHRAGDIRLESTWDEERKVFDVLLSDRLDGKETLRADGFIRPAGKQVGLTARLDGFNPGVAAAFLSSVFSDVDGQISGTVHVNGPLDRLDITSEGTRFDNTCLVVDYTKVPYFADGPFTLTNQGLVFNDVSLRDRYDGTAKLSGGLYFNRFQDIRLGIDIALDRMEALALGAADNSSFYGNAFGSGRVKIDGPLDDIVLSVNATTTKEGNIHIPLGGKSVTRHNLLTFKEPEVQTFIDPYEEMMNAPDKGGKKSGRLSILIKINTTPLIKGYVEIQQTGLLTGVGSGPIDISVIQNNFTIGGKYTLSEGNFHLDVMELTDRDFAIQDGSSIRFTGDIMNSDLDIHGLYRTKASLSRLLSDENAVNTSRLVECGIHISDRIRAPQIRFSIDIPDLDPSTKNRVDTELSSQDKIQKQFVALLLTNNFLPSEQSGIINNEGSAMFQSLTGIMAGQINKIFQRYEIPLDVNMNYQTGSSGYNMFDVAVSTQLFNNRVIVNGNIGNRKTGSSNRADVVGDIDIQLKLNKPGTFRLNLFSHSADAYTNYLDYSQRSGAGFSYQVGFDSFNQFFRNLLISREKRSEMLPSVSSAPSTPRITIQIDSTGREIKTPVHAEP